MIAEKSRVDVLAERVLVDGRLVHPRAPHGRRRGHGYYGCRCRPCTDANRDAMRRYRRLPSLARGVPVGPLAAPQRWQAAPTAGVCGACDGVYQRGALVIPDGS